MRKVTMPRLRVTRRLAVVAAAVVVAAGLGGVALAATSGSASTVIKGCYNATSGALRVLTPKSDSCGSQKKISWNEQGPAGNGYDFTSTAGTLDKYGLDEADGPKLAKAGDYLVNVSADENISGYTTGVSGICTVALAEPTTTYIYESLPPFDYPVDASSLDNRLPTNTTVIIDVTSSEAGYQLLFACAAISSAGAITDLKPTSAHWLVSPIGVTAGTASVARADVSPPRGSKLIP
jgi:hypothetical protein